MNYTITLPAKMLEVIGKLLDQAPHGVARPIVDEIERQLVEQNEKANQQPKIKEAA